MDINLYKTITKNQSEMKKIKYILSIIALTFTVLACDNNDPDAVIDESAKPIVSVSTTTTSISESGSPVITVTIELDRPIKNTTSFSATQVGGNADEDDFVADDAVIPAYGTSTTMEITILDDTVAEGTETLELQIAPNNPSDSYEVLQTPTVSFSIENSLAFYSSLAWEGDYLDADGDTHNFCDFDLDMELYDSTLNDVLDASYSDCPESFSYGSGDLENADYWIVPSFWSNGGTAEPVSPMSIPAKLTFGVYGSSTAPVTIDLSSLWDTATGGYAQGNSDAYLVKYVLTVSGDSYTVTDSDSGSVVFQN